MAKVSIKVEARESRSGWNSTVNILKIPPHSTGEIPSQINFLQIKDKFEIFPSR
jgi:hypothetical protein